MSEQSKDTVRMVTLIETTLTRRGKGVEDDPIRIITQWWTPTGELVVERDPYILLRGIDTVSGDQGGRR